MNWGGDSACIFSADSPNFGGLICSSTVISADLWKLGQLKPGQSFRLTPVTLEDAVQRSRDTDDYLKTIAKVISGANVSAAVRHGVQKLERASIGAYSGILKMVPKPKDNEFRPKVVYRQVRSLLCLCVCLGGASS